MIPVVQLVEYPGMKCPAMLDQLTTALSQSGVRVGVAGAILGSDESRLDGSFPQNAGAAVKTGSGKLLFMEKVDEKPTTDEILLRFFNNVDIVLYRGDAGEGFPEIAVAESCETPEPPPDRQVFALAGYPGSVFPNLPHFSPDDAAGMSAFVSKTFHVRTRKRKKEISRASLLINGKTVGMQKFIEDVFLSVVGGLVKVLKHTEKASEIELRLKLPKDTGTEHNGGPDV